MDQFGVVILLLGIEREETEELKGREMVGSLQCRLRHWTIWEATEAFRAGF